MQSRTQKRYLVYLLLVATFALSGASASSQERKAVSESNEFQVGPALACPFPQHVHLTAPPPNATPYAADFPSATVPLANWNATQPDRHFRHTFTWKSPTDCCQAVRGTLTFKYKALQGGQSATSPNAGNDGVIIYKNGSNLLGLPIYTTFPFPAGYTGTKTIQLTAAMLTNNNLSFQVQDDTAVISATLDVDICCIRK